MYSDLELMEKAKKPSSVPCNGCVNCCLHDAITLKADELGRYAWHLEGDRPVLNRKENGECIYLTDSGCGIHDNRPDLCQRFDCRVLYLITSPEKKAIRISENPTMKSVYQAGFFRLHTL
jgi:Fe-S-cluster containining protein